MPKNYIIIKIEVVAYTMMFMHLKIFICSFCAITDSKDAYMPFNIKELLQELLSQSRVYVASETKLNQDKKTPAIFFQFGIKIENFASEQDRNKRQAANIDALFINCMLR